MFNLGFTEVMVIAAAALLIFGPKRLPELAKGLGKGIRDFKKALEGGDEDNHKTIDHSQIAAKGETATDSAPQKENEPASKH